MYLYNIRIRARRTYVSINAENPPHTVVHNNINVYIAVRLHGAPVQSYCLFIPIYLYVCGSNVKYDCGGHHVN